MWTYLISKLVDGCGGGYTAQFVGVYAHIADTTTPTERHFRITLIYNLVNLLTVFVPPFCGVWIRHSGYMWPSLVGVVGQAVNVLYASFIVPESVTRQAGARFWSQFPVR